MTTAFCTISTTWRIVYGDRDMTRGETREQPVEVSLSLLESRWLITCRSPYLVYGYGAADACRRTVANGKSGMRGEIGPALRPTEFATVISRAAGTRQQMVRATSRPIRSCD